MKLSILICSLPETYSINLLKRLTNILLPQIAPYMTQVEYRIHEAGRQMPTGTKRNELIRNSDGEYFVFIDADDTVMPTYVSDIMRAIEQNPDCITFKGLMTTNGVSPRDWTIKLGSQYTESNGHYYRWPNHISVMKRERVEHVKFPDVWVQEDFIWSKRINDMKLLKSEVHIDKQLYLYDFRTNKPKR